MTTPGTIPIEFIQRSIDEMPFEDLSVRTYLHEIGVSTAEDIEHLGCTGAAMMGLSIEQIASLRLRLAGGGVGLPCYVGIDRFCLAHNTIGGLQHEQMQRHPEYVAAVSRELTPEEAGKVELIEAARRKQGKSLNERLVDTTDILAGREMPKGFEAVDGSRTESTLRSRGVPFSDEPAPAVEYLFICPEHKKTNWSCRYCAAQAVMEGALVPTYALEAMHPETETILADDDMRVVAADQVEANLTEHDKAGAASAHLYVRVATFTRRLAREE
jgi:hypothetical protein